MARILIVDDEIEILKIFEQFLTKMGFDVATARGGLEAVNIIKTQRPFDLMVLDLVMPNFPGVDVLRELQKANIRLPYIILSGTLELQDFIEDLTQMGCSKKDIYSKPIDLFELLEVIKKRVPGNS